MSDLRETKPTLILLHAAGRGGRSWQRLTPLLSDAFTVLTPDLPGFNQAPGPFTLAAAVDAVAELAAAQTRPVRLCGLSLERRSPWLSPARIPISPTGPWHPRRRSRVPATHA